LKTSAIRRSADNLTAVFVGFEAFYNQVDLSKGRVSHFEHDEIELQQISQL